MSETVAIAYGLPSTIAEGEVLGGKYRLEREIGRGSMGTVWLARHLSLGQRVAIKLIAAEHAQAPEARRRFGSEAKAAARLRSRYVVQVYDDGETEAGTPYIVFEYLEGETLEQRLTRERALPLKDAVRITRHVARALSRAHAHGIVHRDLKPANVFLARSEDDELGWVAKVLDFGIAKIAEPGTGSTTKTGLLLGTPLFMSPEQVRGSSSLDLRSDLYSLGQVFFTMLSGWFPFRGESFADVLVAICTQPLPDLRAAVPSVPISVADWYQRACAHETEQRFSSAEEMIEGLDGALGAVTGGAAVAAAIETLPGHAPPGALDSTRAAAAKLGAKLGAELGAESFAEPGASRVPLVLAAVLALLVLLGGALLFLNHRQGPAQSAESASPGVSQAPSVAPIAPAETAGTAAGSAGAAQSATARALPAAGRTSKQPPTPNFKQVTGPRNTSPDLGF